jgi:hypothetical protein
MGRTIGGLTLTALLCFSTSLSAHHSFASEYDSTKKVTLSGVITKVEWTNPHAHFYLDVTDSSGNVVNWNLEGFPPGAMTRIGWTRNMIQVGDHVTVVAYLARDSTKSANVREFTLANGKVLAAGAAQDQPGGDK